MRSEVWGTSLCYPENLTLVSSSGSQGQDFANSAESLMELPLHPSHPFAVAVMSDCRAHTSAVVLAGGSHRVFRVQIRCRCSFGAPKLPAASPAFNTCCVKTKSNWILLCGYSDNLSESERLSKSSLFYVCIFFFLSVWGPYHS